MGKKGKIMRKVLGLPPEGFFEQGVANAVGMTVGEVMAKSIEAVARLVNEAVYTGYALVGGFPGYLVDSIVHTSVGHVDNFRYTTTDYPAELTVGWGRSRLQYSTDQEGTEFYISVSLTGSASVADVPLLNVLPVPQLGSISFTISSTAPVVPSVP